MLSVEGGRRGMVSVTEPRRPSRVLCAVCDVGNDANLIGGCVVVATPLVVTENGAHFSASPHCCAVYSRLLLHSRCAQSPDKRGMLLLRSISSVPAVTPHRVHAFVA